jgi:predicted ATPase
MPISRCDWTLDLAVRCRLSILEARLMTDEPVTVVAGRNGCGKSQLLTIINSYFNTGDRFLKNLGYRNYFSKDRSSVEISGPARVHFLTSARTIARDPTERVSGPYSFAELESATPGNRFLAFRKALSRLALEADLRYSQSRGWSDSGRTSTKAQALAAMKAGFAELFPGRRLYTSVDHDAGEVSVFGEQDNMSFIRPDDSTFSLRVPFATLSDGELNALLFLYDLVNQTTRKHTPVLFLIDEIENHLHPALVIRFMAAIQRLLPPFAMLLATTHSPQVIASVPPRSRVLMMHSAEVASSKSRNQLRVSSDDAGASRLLYELYGAESGTAANGFLQDLTAATAGEVLAYAQANLMDAHAFAGSAPADPQRTFLAGLIHSRNATKDSLRILDVGAGQGRLICGLRTDLDASVCLPIQLDCVEPSPKYREILAGLAVGNQGAVRIGTVFSSASDIPHDKAYDLVLLHNVVHEIAPASLHETLDVILARLSEGGIISVLEQAVLPQGEKRYFVFQATALQRMFEEVGLTAVTSTRTSRSGIPIYEVTAARRDSTVTLPDRLLSALITAVQRTIDSDRARYVVASDYPRRPLEFAFLAFNVVNGELALQALQARLAGRDA